MRLLMIPMLGAAALCAQSQPTQEEQTEEQTARTAAKLDEYRLKLSQAMRLRNTLPAATAVASKESIYSIPLRRVGPGSAFRSNTRVIVPPAAGFAAVKVTPPAPMCEDQTKK